MRTPYLDALRRVLVIRVGQYSAQSNTGLQHETKCKEFKMSQQKIKGLSKKCCHPEFISAIH
ncbi:MAG: hypothetical protein J5930_08820 [Treponema sp.]|nr:hypothetical protein [Treponema sp.]